MQYIFDSGKTLRYSFPTHINDLVMDRSEASYSEVFLVLIESGKAPPLHKHDDTEQIFYIIGGQGTLVTGNNDQQMFDVEPGHVIRIPVSTWHTIRADRGTDIRYLAIDCFGSILKDDEPTWDAHVRTLCREQGWDYDEATDPAEK